MKIKSNQIITKISQLKRPPVLITGFVIEGAKDKGEIRVYPELDSSVFYTLNQDNIIDISIPSNDNDKAQLFVSGDCEIKIVKTNYIKASDLYLNVITKRDCGCRNCKCSCNCNSEDSGEVVALSRKKLREFVLSMGRLLAQLGIDLDCARLGANSMSVSCCRAWNKLAGAIDTLQETAAAQEVEAACFGVG